MYPSDYEELEVYIREKIDNVFPVELRNSNGETFLGGHLSTDICNWFKSNYDPKADGEDLYGKFLDDPVLKSAWDKLRPEDNQLRIRLNIHKSAAELHEIPWELLRNPDAKANLAAKRTNPFSRYFELESSYPAPIEERPIRMLVGISNPTNLAQYSLQAINRDKEMSALSGAIANLGQKVELIELEGPCTLSAIATELRDKKIHILHLIGHGTYNKEDSKGILFLANAQNEVHKVDDSCFAETLALLKTATYPLRLVYLSSCQTGISHHLAAEDKKPNDSNFNGFGPTLIEKGGVSAVIAMQGNITVDSATPFSTTFYSQLLTHGQVDLAMNEARASLWIKGRIDAAIPVLYMRLKDGRIFGEEKRKLTDPKPPDSEKIRRALNFLNYSTETAEFETYLKKVKNCGSQNGTLLLSGPTNQSGQLWLTSKLLRKFRFWRHERKKLIQIDFDGYQGSEEINSDFIWKKVADALSKNDGRQGISVGLTSDYDIIIKKIANYWDDHSLVFFFRNAADYLDVIADEFWARLMRYLASNPPKNKNEVWMCIISENQLLSDKDVNRFRDENNPMQTPIYLELPSHFDEFDIEEWIGNEDVEDRLKEMLKNPGLISGECEEEDSLFEQIWAASEEGIPRETLTAIYDRCKKPTYYDPEKDKYRLIPWSRLEKNWIGIH